MRRLHDFLAVVLVSACLAAPAAAQTGRVQGVVRDSDGRPIRGAVVTAIHPEAFPRQITATTDEKGRFAMLGLRIGTNWRFVAAAPGFVAVEGVARPRTALGLPLVFTMTCEIDAIPWSMARDVQQQLSAANKLRDAGRYEEALTVYQSIQTRNPKLTTISLVLAGVYRDQAQRTPDASARRALLEKAMAAYEHLLKADPGHERARLERADVAAALSQQTK